MSLESRLTEALHQRDDYQPSVDLFARVRRSIEEDQDHRRRIRRAGATAVAGLGLLGIFVAAIADHDPDGVLVLPKWSIQVVMFALLTTCLLVFGPAIRRLGQPYLADAFHINPATGGRFSRLLDIAYYLFFGGGIITSLDLTKAGSLVPASEGLESGGNVAVFLTILGLAHVGNLLLLPIVGLLFGSVTRRARRRAAGSEAPPISRRAQNTDRLALAIVLTAVSIGIGGGLLVVALVIRGISL
jgi:multisubunit Na+/H+ antiporter MnhC subunit